MSRKRRIMIGAFLALCIGLVIVGFIIVKRRSRIKVGTEMINMETYKSASRFGVEELLYLNDISNVEDDSIMAEEVDISMLPVYRTVGYVKSEDGKFTFIKNLTSECVEGIAESIGKRINSDLERIEYCYYKDVYNYSSIRRNELYELMQNIASAKAIYKNGMYATVDNRGRVLVYGIDEDVKDEYSKDIDEYLQNASTGNIRERIVRHSFKYIRLNYDKFTEECYSLELFNLYDQIEYIGDYPIISVDDAKDILMSGNYLTEVPPVFLQYKKVKEKDIARITINYLKPRWGYTEYYVPFYVFYVDITDTYRKFYMDQGSDCNLEDDVKVYGTFFIPAIEGNYLNNYN